MLDRIPVHHPHTASRVFSGDAVVITPAKNMVRMFNPVGSRIWTLIDGQRSVSEIIGILVEEYPDVTFEHAQKTTLDFFRMMESKHLVAWLDEPQKQRLPGVER